MKVKLVLVVVLLAIGGVALAQPYDIRAGAEIRPAKLRRDQLPPRGNGGVGYHLACGGQVQPLAKDKP